MLFYPEDLLLAIECSMKVLKFYISFLTCQMLMRDGQCETLSYKLGYSSIVFYIEVQSTICKIYQRIHGTGTRLSHT